MVPPFSCRYYGDSTDLQTHAPASDLLYHLGPDAANGVPEAMILKPHAAARWRALVAPKVQKLIIRIPARPPPATQPPTAAGQSAKDAGE